jgi:hypothetical protein
MGRKAKRSVNLTPLPPLIPTHSALWVAPVDFLVMLFTFLVTVLWNVELGLEYGIIASVVVLLLQISKLDVDSIGQLSIAEEGSNRPVRCAFCRGAVGGWIGLGRMAEWHGVGRRSSTQYPITLHPFLLGP